MMDFSSQKKFISYLGVHCTHGFNRTGFLICVYLCRESDMSIDAAIDIFSKARSPGIYKQDYLNELLRKYGDESSATITAPVRPEWCNSKKELFDWINIEKLLF
jgi:mRNA-capping enzyme